MSENYANVCLLNYDVGRRADIVCVPPLSVLVNFFVYDAANPQFGDWLVDNDPAASIEAGIATINEVERKFLSLFVMSVF